MKIIHIKWEKITTLIFGIFYIIKIIGTIYEYGFDFEVIMSIALICSIMLFIWYMITLSLRRTLIERNKKDE